MKKLFAFAVGVAVTIYSSKTAAQSTQAVPAAVSQSFENEFRAAASLSWEKISPQVYLARFKNQDEASIAYLDVDGNVLMKGRFIKKDQSTRLFQVALDKFKSENEVRYGSLIVTHIYEVIQDEAIKYFVNMGNNTIFISLTCSSNGRTLDVKTRKIHLNGETPHLIVKK